MRLHLSLDAKNISLPFAYQELLLSSLHSFLGKNDIHDELSLYSMSWLFGGKRNEDRLIFTQGAQWSMSFYDEKLALKVLQGIIKKRQTTFGMTVNDVQIQETPDFGSVQRFMPITPILIKQKNERGYKHCLWNDEAASELLTATLHKKMHKAGLSSECMVRFDTSYEQARTKLVTIHGIHNKASICPVIIDGSPGALGFAWNVGIGHSTGSGFGAIL